MILHTGEKQPSTRFCQFYHPVNQLRQISSLSPCCPGTQEKWNVVHVYKVLNKYIRSCVLPLHLIYLPTRQIVNCIQRESKIIINSFNILKLNTFHSFLQLNKSEGQSNFKMRHNTVPSKPELTSTPDLIN